MEAQGRTNRHQKVSSDRRRTHYRNARQPKRMVGCCSRTKTRELHPPVQKHPPNNHSDTDSGVEHWQLVRLITDLTFYFARVYFAYDLLTIPIQNGGQNGIFQDKQKHKDMTEQRDEQKS